MEEPEGEKENKRKKSRNFGQAGLIPVRQKQSRKGREVDSPRKEEKQGKVMRSGLKRQCSVEKGRLLGGMKVVSTFAVKEMRGLSKKRAFTPSQAKFWGLP